MHRSSIKSSKNDGFKRQRPRDAHQKTKNGLPWDSCLQVDGSPQDYSSYLVERGSSDILFPTDFKLLQALYERLAGRHSSTSHFTWQRSLNFPSVQMLFCHSFSLSACAAYSETFAVEYDVLAYAGEESSTQIYTTAQYMEKYASPDATRTRNGFRPIVEDFSNTSFFCARSKT